MNIHTGGATMDVATTAWRVQRAGLDVATELAAFIEGEALPDTTIEPERFWRGFAAILSDLGPTNRALLAERDRMQHQIDQFHTEHPGQPEPAIYRAFLEEIGYLLPEPGEFTVAADGLDDEIARTAGPQLVVPMLNARFAVNAANARWGSLYDALYGTDAIPDAGEARRGHGYNPVRGGEAVRRGRDLLDEIAPLVTGSHHDVTGYRIVGGALVVSSTSGHDIPLRDPAAFAGYTGAADAPASVLLVHHGLHADVIIDRDSPVGSTDVAGIADIILESAITTIMDLEDSVAAVDAADKVLGYRTGAS
jgi:malate synthase